MNYLDINIPNILQSIFYILNHRVFDGLKYFKSLKKRLHENIRQVETSTFDGVITLITGEKIESEFFHRISDDVFIDRKNKTEFIRDKIVSIKYIDDRRKH